jgi:hypothetical protein
MDVSFMGINDNWDYKPIQKGIYVRNNKHLLSQSINELFLPLL